MSQHHHIPGPVASSRASRKRRPSRLARPRAAWLRGIEALEGRTLLSMTPLDLVPGNLSSNVRNTQTYGVDAFATFAGKGFFGANDGGGYDLYQTDGTAAGTSLFRDVNSGASSLTMGQPTPVGSTLFFTMPTTGGTGLFKTDGSPAGTSLVAEVAGSSSILVPRAAGSKLFFLANPLVTGNNTELWVSDGTAGGTGMVKDIYPGSTSSSPGAPTVIGGAVYFAATDPIGGRELWRSAGTSAGTTVVKDLNPSGSSDPTILGALGDTLIFTANDGAHGTELWATDGTAAGTVQIMEFNAGSASTTFSIYAAVLGGKLLFYAGNGTSSSASNELWQTDGTAAGTVRLAALAPGSTPQPLAVAGATAYFRAAGGTTTGHELWKTDGTAAGTALVRDINPGPGDSSPDKLTAVGGRLLFQADDGAHGTELWSSDGTAAGTVMVADIRAGAASGLLSGDINRDGNARLGASGSLAFFAADDGVAGMELWRSDGTAAGTFRVKDIYPGATESAPTAFSDLGGRLLFWADAPDWGLEPWVSDGTEAGTARLKDVNTVGRGSNPTGLTAVGGRVFFSASDPANGTELWVTDGTAAGSRMVKDLSPGTNTLVRQPLSGSPANLTAVGGTLFFAASGGTTTGVELWKSDGTDSGTVLVKNINAVGGGSSSPSSLVNLNGTLFFVADDGGHGRELWRSDGTDSGTVMVKDLNPGVGVGSNPTSLCVVGSTLFFTADDGTNRNGLWKTDGTSAGTVLVRNMAAPFQSTSGSMAALGGILYFAGNDPATGAELWRSDGTAAGTWLVADAWAGSTGGYPANLTASGGRLYFTASDPAGGTELWVGNGTATGTKQVKDIRAGTASSSPGQLTDWNGTLVFAAFHGSYGSELWKSDGTPAGTVLVKDILAGTGSSGPSRLTAALDRVYFTATDGAAGTELWSTDGTEAGTARVADFNPGAAASNPSGALVLVGNRLFGSGNDGVHGQEPWVARTFSVAGPATTVEGAAYTLTLEADAGAPGDPENRWTVDWGDGRVETFAGEPASVGHVYDDGPASRTVTATFSEAAGTKTRSFQVAVTNAPPVASIAGAPASVDEGTLVTLAASAVDPGAADTSFTYAWSVSRNGADFAGGTGASYTFTPDDNGTYLVTLTAVDKDGGAGTASATVAARNAPPSPAIGGLPAAPPREGSSAVLTASATDPGAADATFAYSWSATKDGASYAAGAGASFSFAPDDDGSYVVSLTAVDKDGDAGTTAATIAVVNAPPTPVIGGIPADPREGTPMALTASATDPGALDRSFSYAWSVSRSGVAYAAGTGASLGFTPVDNGTYVISLTATDKDGDAGTTAATVLVRNVVPTPAIAGLPAVPEEGASTVLTASATDSGALDTSFSYAWSVTRDGSTFIVGTGASFTFAPEDNGTYTLTLRATDKDGGVGATTTRIAVLNVAPTPAIAGVPTGPGEGSTTYLVASATDPGPFDRSFTYAWSVTKDGAAYRTGVGSFYAFTPDDEGTYVITLAATDKDGDAGAATATVVAVNRPPAVVIGGLPAVGLVGDVIAPSVSVSDPGAADAVSYAWSVTLGGRAVASGSGAPVRFTPDAQGSYEIWVTASDGDGGTTTATETLAVVRPFYVTFDAAAGAKGEGSGAWTIGVALDVAADEAVTVPLTVSGTAAAADYTLSATSITIPAGQTRGSVTLSLVDDRTDEPDETVVLDLGAPNLGRVGSVGRFTATITDDDAAPRVFFTPSASRNPAFWLDGCIAHEGDGVMDVWASLSNPSAYRITVPVALTGTATAGADYTLSGPAQFVFEPGRDYARLSLSIADDPLAENWETIQLALQAPTDPAHATVTTSPLETASYTIWLEVSDQPYVDFTTYNSVVDENGPDRSVRLGARLSYAVPYDVTVPIVLNVQGSGYATRGSDFVIKDAAGAEVPTATAPRIVVPAGQLESFVTFEVVDDGEQEPTEWVQADMGEPIGPALGYSSFSLKIPKNDVPRPVVTFSSGVGEESIDGDEFDLRLSPAAITVRLSVALLNDLDVPIVIAGGTATKDVDYRVLKTSVHVPAGKTSVTADILRAVDDLAAEADETVTVKIGEMADAILGSAAETTRVVTIRDDDWSVGFTAAAGEFAVNGILPTLKVSEGAGSYTFDVSLTRPGSASYGGASVPFTLSGVAKEGKDFSMSLARSTGYRTEYNATQGQYYLIFDPGVNAAKIKINVTQDSLIEGDETATITLGTPTLGELGPNRQRTFAITDDDFPTVSFSSSSSSVTEGKIGSITVSLSAPIPDKDVRVQVYRNSSTSTAQNGSDFAVATTSLTIPAGSSSATYSVTTIDDKTYEPTEVLDLYLSTPTNAKLGAVKTHRVTIYDNDTKPAPPPPTSVPPPTTTTTTTTGTTTGTYTPQPSPTPAASYPAASSGGGSLSFGGSTTVDTSYLPPAGSFQAPTSTSTSGGVKPVPSAVSSVLLPSGHDGPLTYAAIFFDANKNGVLDYLDLDGDGSQGPDEPFEVWTVTGLDGVGGLTIPEAFDRDADGVIGAAEGRLVLVGGTDSSTGLPLRFALTAPMGGTAITPLTTLMTALVEERGLSVEDAGARLAGALGLPAVDLLLFDPIAGVLGHDPGEAAVFTAGARVQDAVTQVARLVSGAPGGPSLPRAAALAFSELAARLAASGPAFDLGAAPLVAGLIASVAGRSGVALEPAVVAGAARVIAETDARIVAVPYTADLAFLRAVARVQVVAQGDSADALAGASAGTAPIADVIADFTGPGLDAAVQAAATGNVVPPAVWIDDVRVREGADGADAVVTFAAHLNVPSASPVSLDWETLDGTATAADGDYAAASGHLSWAAGDNAPRTIQVHVRGDVLSEGDETFLVVLGNIAGAISWKDFGTATVADDDGLAYSAPAGDGPNDLLLRVMGGQVELTRNGELVAVMALSAPAPVAIRGADGVANALTIELVGDSTPLLGGLSFTGGDRTTDSLTVVTGPAQVVSHTPGRSGSGAIVVDGAVLAYSSVESVGGGLVTTVLGAPATAPEGTEIVLNASDADEAIGFDWAVTRDGLPYLSAGGVGLRFTPDDDGTYAVTLTARGAGGASGRTAAGFLVTNASPSARLVAPSASTEGSVIAVALAGAVDPSSADAAAGFAYAFDFGSGYGPFGPGSSASFRPADDGTYAVRAKVRDKNGGETEYSTVVRVANAAPSPEFVGTVPSAGPEGTAIRLTGTATDPSAADAAAGLSLAWGVTKDGVAYASGVGGSLSFTPDDDGTYVVTLTATDKDGDRSSVSRTIAATNVAPTPTLGGDTTGVAAQPRRLAFDAADRSGVDLAVGFTYTVDWGDGSPVQEFGPGLHAATASHAYAGTGTYTRTVTARDKDGGVSALASSAITITAFAYEVDPRDPGRTALVIGGTPGNDTIVVNPGGGAPSVQFAVNGISTTVVPPTGHIIVYGGDGDDSITAAGGLGLATLLFGGSGDDTIKGGDTPNIMVGGPGRDSLTGGNARDLLIGGLGTDSLGGVAGDDILIGGTTENDDDLAALCAIMDEWASANDYGTRVGKLTSTTGLLGDGRVWDDLAANALSGASGQELFFVGALDSVSGAGWTEVVRKAKKKT